MTMTVTSLSAEQRQILNKAYVIGRDLGRKFEKDDLMGSSVLMQAARIYAETYTGNFSYMLEMRQQVLQNPMLSHGQAKGVLNTMMADARKEMQARRPQASESTTGQPQASDLLNVTKVLDGRYRVVLTAEDSLSIRLEKSPFNDKPAGSRMISVLANGDEWIGQAGVEPDGTVRFWKKAGEKVRAAVEVIAKADDSLIFGLAYAMVGKVCFFCGRELDTQESITVGYGPICADKRDLPWGAKAEPMAVKLAKAAMEGVEGISLPETLQATKETKEINQHADTLFDADGKLVQGTIKENQGSLADQLRQAIARAKAAEADMDENWDTAMADVSKLKNQIRKEGTR